MAKPPVAERPKAVDALMDITERAVAFRYPNRSPSLSDVVRVVSTCPCRKPNPAGI